MKDLVDDVLTLAAVAFEEVDEVDDGDNKVVVEDFERVIVNNNVFGSDEHLYLEITDFNSYSVNPSNRSAKLNDFSAVSGTWLKKNIPNLAALLRRNTHFLTAFIAFILFMSVRRYRHRPTYKNAVKMNLADSISQSNSIERYKGSRMNVSLMKFTLY
uniref:Uncharacterized protein n=1 Tax=Glossina pallidipes TaxID=7398 RepID=A0A1A9ZGL9_GLOPL